MTWITVADSAHNLRVSERTIRRWIDSGELQTLEVEGVRYVDHAQAEALRHRRRPRPPIAQIFGALNRVT